MEQEVLLDRLERRSKRMLDGVPKERLVEALSSVQVAVLNLDGVSCVLTEPGDLTSKFHASNNL